MHSFYAPILTKVNITIIIDLIKNNIYYAEKVIFFRDELKNRR